MEKMLKFGGMFLFTWVVYVKFSGLAKKVMPPW
jgi:hypothetical protein